MLSRMSNILFEYNPDDHTLNIFNELKYGRRDEPPRWKVHSLVLPDGDTRGWFLFHISENYTYEEARQRYLFPYVSVSDTTYHSSYASLCSHCVSHPLPPKGRHWWIAIQADGRRWTFGRKLKTPNPFIVGSKSPSFMLAING